jgi:NAD(P)H-flavin reductase/hemoglobin-like flavoprotein
MVRLIRESFALVEPKAEEVARLFYGMLFSLAPHTRELFPVNMSTQRSRLLRALVHVVQMVDRPYELVPFLQQLGRDHRKFGVIAEHYDAVGVALIGALKKFAGPAWTPQVDVAWQEAYAVIARTMQDAAAKDEGPAWWNAHVVDHERLAWDLAVVRVQPEYLVPYRAGQYVSVEVPQRPRLWRYFSPANAPREDGVIEFHIRAVDCGWVSRAIVGHTQRGDVWRIGSPMGRMRVDRTAGRDLLMIAGGTGVAPVRAILQDLARWGDNPRAHVFLGGRKAHDLYALESLRRMATVNPWLTVVPVLEDEPEFASVEHGTLVEVVTRYGSWSDRDVVISGSPGMIRATVSRLLVAGTPLDRISYDPFSMD